MELQQFNNNEFLNNLIEKIDEQIKDLKSIPHVLSDLTDYNVYLLTYLIIDKTKPKQDVFKTVSDRYFLQYAQELIECVLWVGDKDDDLFQNIKNTEFFQEKVKFFEDKYITNNKNKWKMLTYPKDLVSWSQKKILETNDVLILKTIRNVSLLNTEENIYLYSWDNTLSTAGRLKPFSDYYHNYILKSIEQILKNKKIDKGGNFIGYLKISYDLHKKESFGKNGDPILIEEYNDKKYVY